MTLTLQHPKALRTAFLSRIKLNYLESYENLCSVYYWDSNDEEEFKELPNIKVVLEYG